MALMATLRSRKPAWRIVDDNGGAKYGVELIGEFGKYDAKQHQDDEADDKRSLWPELLYPRPRLAHERQAQQREPHHVKRHLGQLGQERARWRVGRQRQQDGNQLGDEQNNEDRGGGAEIGQVNLRVAR